VEVPERSRSQGSAPLGEHASRERLHVLRRLQVLVLSHAMYVPGRPAAVATALHLASAPLRPPRSALDGSLVTKTAHAHSPSPVQNPLGQDGHCTPEDVVSEADSASASSTSVVTEPAERRHAHPRALRAVRSRRRHAGRRELLGLHDPCTGSGSHLPGTRDRSNRARRYSDARYGLWGIAGGDPGVDRNIDHRRVEHVRHVRRVDLERSRRGRSVRRQRT
jgi:hypothetical protein